MSSPTSDSPRRPRGGKRAAERKVSRRSLRTPRPGRGARSGRRGKSDASPSLALLAEMDKEPAPAEPAPAAPAPAAPAPAEPAPAAPVPAQGAASTAVLDGHEVRPPRGPSRVWVTMWIVLGLAGVVALVASGFELGPHWLDKAGAVTVTTVIAWLLAARTSGRALVAATLAAALGTTAVLVGGTILPTGAAVLACALGGVYAVMVTVPAATWWGAVREVGVATFVSGISALAVVGFEPTVAITRFDLATVAVALVLCGAVVHRLGAGFHGLGRRGMLAVAVGAAVLVVTLAYAEVLRRYGAQGLVSSVLDFVEVTRDRIGAFPRPLVVLLGLPALAWGVHLRARRRQGWWVTMFGVTATVPMAAGLVPPDDSFLEAVLRAAYSLALGLPLGWLVIRADLALGGSRTAGARRAEEAAAVRPEPSRFEEL